MRRKLLAVALVIGIIFTTVSTVFAATIEDSALPSYLQEQDEGLYIAGQKVTESGTYAFVDRALKKLDEVPHDQYIQVDLENRQLAFSNVSISVETPLNSIVNDKPDPEQEPVGVLCETKGYATSDSGTVFQTLDNYVLLTAGIAVLNQTGDWTITLNGTNSLFVNSQFATPNRNAPLAMPVFGIYMPSAMLTIQGNGALTADVQNNQQSRAEGVGYLNPVSGIFCGGLSVSQATVEVKTSSNRSEDGAKNYALYNNPESISAIDGQYASILSVGDTSITAGAKLSVFDNLDISASIASIGTLSIAESSTVSVSSSGDHSYNIAGTSVNIQNSNVSVTASGYYPVGVLGTEVTITGDSTSMQVNLGEDENAVGMYAQTLTISASEVTIEAATAFSGETVHISGGAFSSDPSDYLTEGYIATQQPDGSWIVTDGTTTPDTPVVESPYSIKVVQQIRLIEPWGLRTTFRLRDKSNQLVSVNTVTDYGIYFIRQSYLNGVDAEALTPEMLNTMEGAVRADVCLEANGNDVVAIYDDAIYTYELNEPIYALFYYTTADGTWFRVVENNLYEMAKERKDSVSGPYTDLEKSVFSALCTMYESVTAYRQDYYAKNPQS